MGKKQQTFICVKCGQNGTRLNMHTLSPLPYLSHKMVHDQCPEILPVKTKKGSGRSGSSSPAIENSTNVTS